MLEAGAGAMLRPWLAPRKQNHWEMIYDDLWWFTNDKTWLPGHSPGGNFSHWRMINW
jgi:hypothetical protein